MEELADQLEFGRHLRRKRGGGQGRLALWGWSYGGFMASLAFAEAVAVASPPAADALAGDNTPPAAADAAAGDGVFTAMVAVAPVTSWEYYDSAYTERFMLTPGENGVGYAGSSIMSRLTGNGSSSSSSSSSHPAFLLAHGTADDNVHFQHAADLVRTLTTMPDGPRFESQFYTDEDHGLGGVTRSLYATIVRFLARAATADC
jgi:dipeptidyl aminopeptidase/acylaminoacyl peptidase